MVCSDKVFIGKKFKMYRQKLKLTQDEVAERINIEPSHYGKLERGIYYPSVETFLNLISLLNIPIQDFCVEVDTNVNNIQNCIIKEVLSSTEKENQLFYSIIKNIKEINIK